jgi:hypothetical protein
MPTQIPVQPKASWMAETARYIDFLAAGGGHHQRVRTGNRVGLHHFLRAIQTDWLEPSSFASRNRFCLQFGRNP